MRFKSVMGRKYSLSGWNNCQRRSEKKRPPPCTRLFPNSPYRKQMNTRRQGMTEQKSSFFCSNRVPSTITCTENQLVHKEGQTPMYEQNRYGVKGNESHHELKMV